MPNQAPFLSLSLFPIPISISYIPFSFPFPYLQGEPCNSSPSPHPLQQNHPPLGSFTPSLLPSSSFPREAPGFSHHLLNSRMLSTALFSCRWELSKANNLGRRAPRPSTGVLAWPHPCQADEPCPAQVRAPLGRTQHPSPNRDLGDDLDFGCISCLCWLLPALCQALCFCPLPSL